MAREQQEQAPPDTLPVAAQLVLDGSRIETAAGDAVTVFARPLDLLVGVDVLTLVHHHDAPILGAFLTLHSPSGDMGRVTVRVRHPDRGWVHTAWSLAASQTAARCTATVSLLDERSGIGQLDALFAEAPRLFMVCSDTQILAASESAQQVLGWTAEEYMANYLDLIHPDDLATTIELSSLVTNSPGQVVRQVGRMRHKDGTYRVVESSVVNLLDDPALHATFVAMRLVPRSEASARDTGSVDRFQAMVNQTADPVLVISPDGVVTYASSSLEHLSHRPSLDVIGSHSLELVLPADRAELLSWWDEMMTEPGTTATRRMRLETGSPDEEVWVEAAMTNFIEDPTIQGILVTLRDITDRVAVEAEVLASDARLREREEWFRNLVQHSFEITVVVDADLKASWASPSGTDLLGWQPEEIVGQDALDFVHPDDHQLVIDHLALVLSGSDERPQTTLRIRQTDGSYRWMDASGSDRTEDPAVHGIIVNLRDATARVEAEVALQRSERRFRQLVQNSTDIVQIMAATGEVLWVSPAVEQALGWKPDEIVGHPSGGLAGLDGREAVLAAFLAVLDEPGRSEHTVCQVEHGNGSKRWLDVVLVNRLDDPDIAGIVATYRDITDRMTVEDARRESEERFRSLANSSPLGIFQFDLDANCVYVNERWCEIVGHPAEDALGDGWRQIVLPEHASLIDDEHLGGDAPPENALSFRGRFRRGDGRTRWADIRTAPLLDDQGNQVGTVGTIDDVTDRVEAQHETELLTTILEATPDLIAIGSRDGTLLYLNEAARTFFGIDRDRDLTQIDLNPHVPIDAMERWQSEIMPSLRVRDTWQGELSLIDREGRLVPVSLVLVAHRGVDHHIEQISVNARDISDRKALEARLEHEATHDPLTGLPNRTLLLDRLDVAIGRARRQHRRLAVLFLDLDHFKVVNDSLGHSTGDQLLAAVAARLTDHVRPGDTVARFGGDEFVVVCEEVESIYEVEEIAGRIATAVAEPVWIGEAEVFVTSSVGIALASDLHLTPEQLLRDADAAMYQAKEKGRNRHEVFDSRLRTRALDRLEVENSLRRALVRHELRVHYQPCFDLQTNAVVGVEALLRWEHPQRGLLLPAEFLRIAEETGLVVPVGAWVLHQACRQMQRLRTELPEFADLGVAVNLSARQITHPYLVDEVAKAIEDTGTRPDTLMLEITESVLMDDITTNVSTLRRLKDLGVSLAIDDFGTGYSSLAYLRRFPVDLLKVDRSFVNGLGSDPEDAAIVQTVITLAHTLGLEALAEGVESPLQQDELRRLGCNQAQGFLLGRPMSIADLTDFLVARGGHPVHDPQL